jgi:hypothetical protein
MREPAKIAAKLEQFVSASATDPVYRRLLRRRPAEALAVAGLPADAAPAELPVQHYRVSAHLDPNTLFGLPSAAPRTAAVPIEARLVMYGAKPLALLHGTEIDMSAVAHWARERGLSALMSPKEFTPIADPCKAGYSNLASEMRPAQAGSGAWRGLLVAGDSSHAMLGWLCLLFGWDEFLGGLLGYPECCANAFARNWPRLRDHFEGDGATALAEQADPLAVYEPGTNIFLRYFGIRTVEHFPCRLDCEPTLRMAESILGTLASFEPDTAQDWARMLGSTVLFTPHDGVFVLRDTEADANVDRVECRYDPSRVLASTKTTRTARAVLAGSSLQARSGEVQVSGERLPGRLLRFSTPGGS